MECIWRFRAGLKLFPGGVDFMQFFRTEISQVNICCMCWSQNFDFNFSTCPAHGFAPPLTLDGPLFPRSEGPPLKIVHVFTLAQVRPPFFLRGLHFFFFHVPTSNEKMSKKLVTSGYGGNASWFWPLNLPKKALETPYFFYRYLVRWLPGYHLCTIGLEVVWAFDTRGN